MKQKIIINPIGTSIFTNLLREKVPTLNMYTNSKVDEIPDEIVNSIKDVERDIENRSDFSVLNLRNLSAELNGIIGIYNGQFPKHSADIIYFLHTDTYLGERAAYLVGKILSRYLPDPQIVCIKNLNTKSIDDFHSGIKELLNWCYRIIPDYRACGYEIIFNLTGGFKALQGYLNTIGMFYADKIVYIFEQSQELIIIPKLPIELDLENIRRNASILLQLSQTNVGFTRNHLSEVPDIMLEHYENGRHIFSEWGEFLWNTAKGEILSAELVKLPRIFYHDSFKRDFKNITDRKRRVDLQETIASICCLLEEHNGDISCLKGGRGGGLLYDNYQGDKSHLAHFRLNNGDRVSCQYIDGVLQLRHCGQHDYVNNNP